MSETLRAPSVILDRPQLAENIGAVARVMANFGLSDLRLVAPRDGWPQERAWASAAGGELHAASAAGLATGLLFGAERAGLETADIAFCQAIVTIPIDPKFRSLNLAQAVALNAYEWRMAIANEPPAAFREEAEPAAQAELIGLYE